MITIERTLTVAASPEAAVTYLRDFSHTTEWDDGTVECQQIDSGDIGVGTRFRNVSTFAGSTTELVYTLVDDTAEHIRFEGENKTARTADDMTLHPHGAGTRLVYRAELRFVGAARLLTPVLRIAFTRLADRTERQLQRVLDGLEPRG